MKKLLIILLSVAAAQAQESPHKNMEMDCGTCHATESWSDVHFDHDKTSFPLEEKHAFVDCQSCHNIEDFTQVESACVSCHQDVHEAKLGSDCQRCHKERGWEIFDVEEIHADTRFPIMGAHNLVDCQSCHQNAMADGFMFDRTECIACHQQSYLAAANPNHVENRFSTQCETCHEMNDWHPAFLPNHDPLFPIFSGEHAGAWNDCQECHSNPATFTEFTCLTCHEHRQDAMARKHLGMPGYSYESVACLSCHPQGTGGEFRDHDAQFFPIFSGTHSGEWSDCVECHNNPGNRKDFTCLTCHEHAQAEMDSKHQGMPGYVYQSSECLVCHPDGREGEFQDHDAQFFPIFSRAHSGEWTECQACHENPSDRKQFTCVSCHEHAQPEMDTAHQGVPGYAYQSSECLLCHPNGQKGEFTDHDAQFFPIFSGAHSGQWTECMECHNNPADRKQFTCLSCHEHAQPEMDATHQGVPGYAYQSSECLICHPDGQKGEFTDHDVQFFPVFSGTHSGQWTECMECHNNPSDRKQFTCLSCHEHAQPEMDTAHQGVPGYAYQSSECLICHPDGQKGEFTDHDTQFFPIFSGTHSGEWTECMACHENPSDRRQFTCVSCHEHAQPEMDTAHQGVPGYAYQSSECLICHPDGQKGEFTDHDAQFFPIFSGKHSGEWTQCVECHDNPADRKQFTCLSCHEHSQSRMDDKHLGEVRNYVYESNACYDCHPNGRAED